jgi:hypothetical protein
LSVVSLERSRLAETDDSQRATDNYCRWSKEAQNNQNLTGNQSITGFKWPAGGIHGCQKRHAERSEASLLQQQTNFTTVVKMLRCALHDVLS